MLGNEGAQETACSTATETTIPAKTENYLWVQVFKKVSSEINIGEWKSVIRHLLGKFCLLIACPCYNYALGIFKLFIGTKGR